ncbi:ABC transporter permease [Oceanirhabdus sp. W0125-5]|uniref:ABC transporter permease n=1 Tax=Oceanirhabdus sp. W0125-5 TaxID=2999116 RepID=UPI0022F31F6E|nr:ABC transporter permease [Oceanirhabdus sp. W0125-5]WBW98396.1 ABC transporter permease [Oceanirhabdus sp. W0125-5]
MKDAVKNISSKYYKENKGRNRLVVLAIILSTCLFTSICIFVSSINHSMKMERYRTLGGQHMILFNLNDEQIEKVDLFQRTDEFGKLNEIGEVLSEKLQENKQSVKLVYKDQSVLKFNGMSLNKGKYPVESDEIVAESRVIENLGGQGEIGENIKITYSLGNSTETKEFKVVGILREKSYKKRARVGEIVLSENFVSNMGINEFDVYVKMKGIGSSNITESCFKLQRLLELNEEQVKVNLMLINDISIDPTAVIGGGMVGLLVILVVTVVIYNIFYISVRERVNILGLLSAVGTTRKQISKIIKNEGRRAALIGIPFGIVTGYVLSYIIIPLTMSNINIEIHSTPFIIPLVALIAYLTVALGMRKPIKIASKVSPIEAVKYTGAENLGKKKGRKSYKKVDVRTLAKENFLRNKKRTVMTILSLSLSGILFITASTILSSMSIDSLLYGRFIGEHRIVLNRQDIFDVEVNPIKDEFIEKIKKIDGVKDVMLFKYRTGKKIDMDITKRESEFELYGYSDSTLDKLQKYVIEGKIDKEKMKKGNGIVLFNRNNSYSLGHKIQRSEIEINSGKEYINEYEVIAIVDELPTRVFGYSKGITGITHADNMPRNYNDKYIGMEIDAKNGYTESVGNELEIICNGNPSLEFGGMVTAKKDINKELMGLKSIIYALVIVIGVIGILNMVNTMVTSILSRKKEFGLLQAIGLSNKGLSRMIQLEGIYYAAISSIISVGGGTIVGKYAFKLFKTEAEYAIYKYPLVAVISTVGILFLLQLSIIYFVKGSIGKDSIVERIRHNV